MCLCVREKERKDAKSCCVFACFSDAKRGKTRIRRLKNNNFSCAGLFHKTGQVTFEVILKGEQ